MHIFYIYLHKYIYLIHCIDKIKLLVGLQYIIMKMYIYSVIWFDNIRSDRNLSKSMSAEWRDGQASVLCVRQVIVILTLLKRLYPWKFKFRGPTNKTIISIVINRGSQESSLEYGIYFYLIVIENRFQIVGLLQRKYVYQH